MIDKLGWPLTPESITSIAPPEAKNALVCSSIDRAELVTGSFLGDFRVNGLVAIAISQKYLI